MRTSKLKDRKENLEKRLLEYGLKYDIVNTLYFKFNKDDFANPVEIATRMMILYALFFAATNPDKIKKIKDWLTKVNLWKDVSDIEKIFLNEEIEDETKIIEFTWNIEKVYILAWTLNLVTERPFPTDQISDKQFNELISNLPELGSENIADFLNNQKLRDLKVIYDENLFNELVTSHFRDLIFYKKEDRTNLDPVATFERHYALNWVRRFCGIKDWDETDTST